MRNSKKKKLAVSQQDCIINGMGFQTDFFFSFCQSSIAETAYACKGDYTTSNWLVSPPRFLNVTRVVDKLLRRRNTSRERRRQRQSWKWWGRLEVVCHAIQSIESISASTCISKDIPFAANFSEGSWKDPLLAPDVQRSRNQRGFWSNNAIEWIQTKRSTIEYHITLFM